MSKITNIKITAHCLTSNHKTCGGKVERVGAASSASAAATSG